MSLMICSLLLLGSLLNFKSTSLQLFFIISIPGNTICFFSASCFFDSGLLRKP